MKQNRNNKTTSKNISNFTILPLGLTLITLYVNTQSEDAFNTPKFLILLFTSCLLFMTTISAYIKNYKSLPRANRAFILSVIIFNCAQIFSLVFSNNFYVSFFGDTQRKNGFLFYFCLSIILIYCSFEINFAKAEKIIKLVVSLASILTIYGLMQIYNLDPVNWMNPYNAMILTLGNPNFASAFLAILWIIAFICLHQKVLPGVYSLILVFTLLLSLYCIIKSQSRQGLVTIAIALSFYLCVLCYIRYSRYFLIALSVIVISLIFMVLGMLQRGPFEAILYKDSVSVRGYYWRAGLKMFLEHPLFGVGLDNYGSYFKEFRDAEYSLKYGFSITSSNAHNVVIQFFSTGGVFVGLSYLLLVLFALIIGIKLILKTSGRNQSIALVFVTAWIAYLAQSFISIDFIVLPTFGWVFAGVISGLYFTTQKSAINTGNLHAKQMKKNNLGTDWLINYGVTIIFLTSLTPLSLYLHRAERDAYQLRATPNSITADVNKYTNQILDNPVADPYYKYKSILRLYEIGNNSLAEYELKKLLNSDSRNIPYLEALAFYKLQENDVYGVIQLRNSISKVDPWNAENYYYLANLYLLSQDTATAKSLKLKILSFAASTEYGMLAKRDLP